MKITKQGKHPDENIWIGKCSVCGTEAEAAKKELKIHDGDMREGSFGEIKCPTCDGRMIFYPKPNKSYTGNGYYDDSKW